MKWLFALLMAAFFGTALAQHPTIIGKATAFTGDALLIEGKVIFLHGVDAPEPEQTCTSKEGFEYRCGAVAKERLGRVVGSNTVVCVVTSVDSAGRVEAVCIVDNFVINQWLVKEGIAVYAPSSPDYESAQSEARMNNMGIWAGTFKMPWDFRNGATGATPSPSNSSASTSPATTPSATPATSTVYYANCDAARAAGAAPIYRGQPGYASHLDADNDGVACEPTNWNSNTPSNTPTTTPSTGRCWVNGYRRANGTYVAGYWRSC